MSVSVFKNRDKARRRRSRGSGQRDVVKFPTKFGPATNARSVNFYGHFSRGRLLATRRAAGKIRAASVEADEKKTASILDALPLWLKRTLRRQRRA